MTFAFLMHKLIAAHDKIGLTIFTFNHEVEEENCYLHLPNENSQSYLPFVIMFLKMQKRQYLSNFDR